METSNDTVARPASCGGARAARERGNRVRVSPGRLLLALGWLAVASPAVVSGQDANTPSAEPAPPTRPAPSVDLGRLLKLPDSYQQPNESRRGMGQTEWESRFELVRMDLSTARNALESAQKELGEAAGDSSQWSVAAPGTTPNPENTPLSYKLRQEIRRQREEVERAERKLRALEIEADLAEVPAAWRAPGVGQPRPDSAGTQSEVKPVRQ